MADPQPLTFHLWRPAPGAPAAWAGLALVHGLGSHGAAFAPLAEALTAAGLVVTAVDLPGHGRSPGPRGGLRHWRQFRDAVSALLQHTAAAAPGLPLVLLGHSLGGAIVLDYVQAHPASVAAAVVANPALALWPSWRLRLVPLLAVLWPALPQANGIALESTARDPAVWETIRHDPLRHDRITAGLVAALLRVQRQLRRAAPSFPVPLLILISNADTVVNPAATCHYRDAVASGRAGCTDGCTDGCSDVTLIPYADSLHELFDDLERQRVRADLLAWLGARFAAPLQGP